MSHIHNILPAPFDLIDIPEGKVTLGNIWDDDENAYLNKNQPREVMFPAFAIAKYPVTNAQFAKFAEAGGYQEQKWWTPDGWAQKAKADWMVPRYWRESKWNGAEQPVVGLSWFEAVAFCLWLSEITEYHIMLLTNSQWQRAAQGDDGRAYPWGDEWDCQCCNNSVKPCESNETTLVTKYEAIGNSPFDVVDMVGNVYEWCRADSHSGTDQLNGWDVCALRGGSWDSDTETDFYVVNRGTDNPAGRTIGVGFRFCLSLS